MSDRICGSQRVGREIWRVEEGVGGQVHDDRGDGVEISPKGQRRAASFPREVFFSPACRPP